jgi:hypothetical protein
MNANGCERVVWLGRQDSNLGMAESKSKRFALFINGHSKKSRKFDLRPIKRLAGLSESRSAYRHQLNRSSHGLESVFR